MSCCKCESDNAACFCLDCDALYCQDCSDRIHQACDADHSLEPLAGNDGKKYFPILTLFADEIIVCIVGCLLWFAAAIPANYFDARPICPFLSQCRRLIATIDAGANALLQGSHFEACSIEDGFWRFYADMWLRSVVTGSDSVVVLLASSFHALFSDVIVIMVMIPVISFLYALLFWVLYLLENALLAHRPDLWWLERWAHILNVIDFAEDFPPVTLPRSRDAIDCWDWFTYPIVRITRVPRYYYSQISDRLQSMLYWSVIFVLTVRITCIFFGVRALVIVGLVASVLIHVYAKFWEFWPLSSSTSWKMIWLMIAGVAAFAPGRFREHHAMFAHVKPGQTFTEQVFWMLMKDVLHVDRPAFIKLLCAGSVLLVLVLASLPFFRHLCKRRYNKTRSHY